MTFGVSGSQARMDAMVEAIRAVPGVEGVAAVNGGVPFGGGYARSSIYLPGRGELMDEDLVDLRQVTAGYLEVLRVPLVAGRFLTEEDTSSRAKVIVVNESAASRYWPGQNPIGQHVGHSIEDGLRTVVGIVGDIRHLGPERPRRAEMYVPLEANIGVSLVIRTAGDPMGTLPAVKRAVWSVAPDQFVPAQDVTLESRFARLIAKRRFNMALLGLLGVLALVIAATGVYGVMAYVVSQRTQEIGVRMALGARPADVMSMVMSRAGWLVASGLAIGMAAAWLLAAGVQPFLFLVASHDWRVFAVSVMVLGVSGIIACVIPARRAARVDPLIALRGD